VTRCMVWGVGRGGGWGGGWGGGVGWGGVGWGGVGWGMGCEVWGGVCVHVRVCAWKGREKGLMPVCASLWNACEVRNRKYGYISCLHGPMTPD
jgi:hypothetical protein